MTCFPRVRPLLVATVACLLGCRSSDHSGTSPASAEKEVQAALARYAAFTLEMASDSLASFFTADGELAAAGQAPIIGPEAIASHLHSFAAFKVLADTLRADTTLADSTGVHQAGVYWQRVRIPRGDTVTVHGRFRADWVRRGPGVWRLRRLATVP